MPKYDIPVILTIEADDFDHAVGRAEIFMARSLHFMTKAGAPKANEAAYSYKIELNCEKDNYNQRVIYLHPDDVDADYDVAEYQTAIDDDQNSSNENTDLDEKPEKY